MDLDPSKLPDGTWTDKENCKNEAKKYKTRLSFYKYSKSAYMGALRNGWLGEICSHMHTITLDEICSLIINDYF